MQEIADVKVSTYFVRRLLTASTAIKLPAPPTQPVQLLEANATFLLAVKLNVTMHAWILHEEKEGYFFMNINEQTVSCNLKSQCITFHSYLCGMHKYVYSTLYISCLLHKVYIAAVSH